MRLEDFFEEDKHGSVRKAFQLVSPMARRAIQEEILPQIESMVSDENTLNELYDESRQMLVSGFKSKSEIYTRMIQYKSIDQSDEQFERDLLACLSQWHETQKKLFDETPESEGIQEVNLQDLLFER